MYSNDEMMDMLCIYFKSNRNSVEALLRYTREYPERSQPHRTLFGKLERNLREYGCFNKPRPKTRPSNTQLEETILGYVNYNPNVSSRELSAQFNSNRKTVRKIIKKYKYRPYKGHLCQALYPNDQIRRLTFCRWFQNKIRHDDNFTRKIMWTDESCFTNNGIFNRNNFHYYADHNPYVIRETRHQVRFSLNVWCGIIGNRLIGPYIFDGNLTGERYLNFIARDLEDFFDDLPLDVLQNLEYFQQDGAPAHNTRNVANFLNNRFINNWIGTNGHVRWPPRSPDLTCLDYFLWGHLKNEIYKRPVNDAEELRVRITQACRNVNPDFLSNATHSMVKRTRLCIQQNGGHFEQLI